jgi:hypothetical protein
MVADAVSDSYMRIVGRLLGGVISCRVSCQD